jgi:hypothetical protein
VRIAEELGREFGGADAEDAREAWAEYRHLEFLLKLVADTHAEPPAIRHVLPGDFCSAARAFEAGVRVSGQRMERE